MSASDLLLILTHKWNKALDNNKETRAVALDIAGAFDSVWHKGLIRKLEAFGICGNLLSLLQDYLQERSFVVALNGQESSSFPISAGVPQGSVLGPIFWNIYMNDLLDATPESIAYADDCTLHVSYPRDQREEGANKLQRALDLTEIWCRRWQVKLAADKTQTCIFSRHQDINVSPEITLTEKILQLQESLSILGVTIDSKLSFGQHVRALAQKASQKLSVLRRIKGFLDKEGLAVLYKTQVRSLLEYAPLSWGGAPPSYLKKLDAIQRRAEKIISGEEDSRLDTLQHRRDVAGLVVFFKANVQKVSHLRDLRGQPARTEYCTRAAENQTQPVYIPTPSTSQFQRSYMYSFSMLWNELCKNYILSNATTLQEFKCLVNRHLNLLNP